MIGRESSRAAAWAIGAALVWGWDGHVDAQTFAPPVIAQPARPSAPATMGGTAANGFANPYANPFLNPMMNPYLNPYMTQGQLNPNDSLLYFMAAQQARGGLGSSVAPGGSNAAPMASRAGMAGGAAAGGLAPRMPAGRVAPSRPRPNYHVSSRFDDNPSYNDRRGRLARSYAAYGSVPINAETGAPVTPGRTPAPNASASQYFNRYPANKANNGR
jgi:hypothetical protein